MSKTVFTKVDYDLDSLVNYIRLGEIGLPDIQRPFVWKNSKVRDLFDSMYKGYPVGYLLFWQNTLAEPKRTIGMEQKQKPPRLVIVDGQQRLTSLYAVIKNIPVIRENFESEHIKIAFNPMEERFEVADAAIRRDKAFLPDISILWSDDAKITRIIREYLENLRTSREVSDGEELVIEDRILRLQKLQGFPFTALELSSDVDEEAVSDVFVRINSKGTPLNQADFILTLMSVFWDEGRTALEKFSRDSRKPSKGVASPYNHFIEPYPDQLLRVGVGVAFKRARLKYVYSILRGKDLETEKFSDERREQQFKLLKDAQNRVLDLQYWHDFMNCIRQAGFRSSKMISSQNNLLFSYILYLIGRTEYKVPEFSLRQSIARWFFMASVTGRFTGSPESAMEFDLARLRDVKNADEFISKLNYICDITITGDFWTVTLPNDLATSSPRSPSLFAYQAALVLLEARALFSKIKVSDLLDPSVQANRSAVERHHLFPKGYLSKLGISSIRDTNQIANYALVEWGDNSNIISDQAPADYLPEMKERFSNHELERMYYWHAMPDNWENMEYQEFLLRRRELMACVIRDAYLKLTGESIEESQSHIVPVEQLVNNGEAVTVEFKSTLRINLHTGEKDTRIELSVLKTIAAFLNSNGGTLIIGVTDNGDPLGIEADNFASEDKMYLHLVNLLNSRLGPQHMIYIHPRFDDYQEARVMIVECLRSKSPVFVKDGSIERFYVRTGAATTELFGSQMHNFIKQRFES
ncbi:GmrSD restriction endonuclease domain-containing protein [Dethiobacter alkaliphilus]|uniref:GmrSD restriction endonuclease domain-containing protein n=1 Tax=Dethiobacter alkaliphilus TaxID=427926 RepID=UPI00222769F1|nr:DUF262 domain-containing protein [Dethiobacter alkaliphilus]MCW3490222.1 DUF262 domain-containing protein [Dethiobacter alkaliphilus]